MAEESIHDACGRGDVEAVRAMIAADPGVVDADDEHGWRPIFHAGLWRREAVVRLLIEAGADLAAHDGDAMHYAGEVPDNKSIVALLIQYGALDAHVRPADDLSRQFLAAVFLANAARVRSLLDRHPHLAAAADGRGDRPIHHAARNGDAEIVRLLMGRGADVDAMTTRGQSVLFCAGGHGHLGVVRILLDAGADRNARAVRDGKTLLEWLDQFPGDRRFAPIAEELRRRGAGA
ncbi:ankyrin repeat domain-containing protein [Paludisphaera mucosa]|uniref:Ankyrin repeat domain-containing protein n=1 Tax=Paludisphaera mucosa TaxID=3030827 RepID=A0ABT6FC35_9BACT|nr:ankyrin repeat domain-containing protein [Paludisphaera mucosa]MDG3005127.1 ankyrin repeat domain-containing protein [Paludisphaera mucosa]